MRPLGVAAMMTMQPNQRLERPGGGSRRRRGTRLGAGRSTAGRSASSMLFKKAYNTDAQIIIGKERKVMKRRSFLISMVTAAAGLFTASHVVGQKKASRLDLVQ